MSSTICCQFDGFYARGDVHSVSRSMLLIKYKYFSTLVFVCDVASVFVVSRKYVFWQKFAAIIHDKEFCWNFAGISIANISLSFPGQLSLARADRISANWQNGKSLSNVMEGVCLSRPYTILHSIKSFRAKVSTRHIHSSWPPAACPPPVEHFPST